MRSMVMKTYLILTALAGIVSFSPAKAVASGLAIPIPLPDDIPIPTFIDHNQEFTTLEMECHDTLIRPAGETQRISVYLLGSNQRPDTYLAIVFKDHPRLQGTCSFLLDFMGEVKAHHSTLARFYTSTPESFELGKVTPQSPESRLRYFSLMFQKELKGIPMNCEPVQASLTEHLVK